MAIVLLAAKTWIIVPRGPPATQAPLAVPRAPETGMESRHDGDETGSIYLFVQDYTEVEEASSLGIVRKAGCQWKDLTVTNGPETVELSIHDDVSSNHDPNLCLVHRA